VSVRVVALAVTVSALVAGCSGATSPVAHARTPLARPETTSSSSPDIVIAETVQRWGRDVGVNVLRETRRVQSRVDRLLHSKPVPITISVGPVVGQTGVGGVTDGGTGAVSISVATTSPLPRHAVLAIQLRRTLAHELDHAARDTAGPGYGSTLLDSIVSEGLADNFATSLYPNSLAPWTHSLTLRQEHRFWKRATQHLYEVLSRPNPYNHWMFGGGAFPHWTGYTLGDDLVAAAHHRHPRSWAWFTRQSSDDILKLSHFSA